METSNSSNQPLPPLKKVLICGSGGRENALAWAICKCKSIQEVWVAPGYGGTSNHQGCKRLAIKENDATSLIDHCLLHKVDLVVIGPEAPLAKGLADQLRNAGLAVFGPSAKGAQGGQSPKNDVIELLRKGSSTGISFDNKFVDYPKTSDEFSEIAYNPKSLDYKKYKQLELTILSNHGKSNCLWEDM